MTSHGSCASCGRHYRSAESRKRAENFLAVHVDLARSVGKEWPPVLTKHDRGTARSRHWKQHGEIAA